MTQQTLPTVMDYQIKQVRRFVRRVDNINRKVAINMAGGTERIRPLSSRERGYAYSSGWAIARARGVAMPETPEDLRALVF